MRITHLSLTPTVAALVEPMNVPSVEFLVTAGEALTEKVFNSWKGKGLFQGMEPEKFSSMNAKNIRLWPKRNNKYLYCEKVCEYV